MVLWFVSCGLACMNPGSDSTGRSSSSTRLLEGKRMFGAWLGTVTLRPARLLAVSESPTALLTPAANVRLPLPVGVNMPARVANAPGARVPTVQVPPALTEPCDALKPAAATGPEVPLVTITPVAGTDPRLVTA